MVPKVDSDRNEIGGIHTIQQQVATGNLPWLEPQRGRLRKGPVLFAYWNLHSVRNGGGTSFSLA
jgi:hypothetical protein